MYKGSVITEVLKNRTTELADITLQYCNGYKDLRLSLNAFELFF